MGIKIIIPINAPENNFLFLSTDIYNGPHSMMPNYIHMKSPFSIPFN